MQSWSVRGYRRFSRTRGGDPRYRPPIVESSCVFPAHAGVILKKAPASAEARRFSRTRGGDPG